jgi:choline dehydrogenase-like flavoprotein
MVIRPAYVESFARSTTSRTVDDARHLRADLRRRKLGDLGKHLASVSRDLMSWQSVTIPGAPLPVPFPELAHKFTRSARVEAQALLPGIFGDIATSAYAKTVGAPLEHVVVRTRIDPSPNPDSRVMLSHERDALGMPKTRLDWRLSRIDHYSVRRALELLGAEVGRAGVGRLQTHFSDDENTWPEDLAGGYHHIGTTRMSSDPKQGVVDRNVRVHHMANFYIAGSSVFPSAGSGTPTLTAVALALRLADHLKEASA